MRKWAMSLQNEGNVSKMFITTSVPAHCIARKCALDRRILRRYLKRPTL